MFESLPLDSSFEPLPFPHSAHVLPWSSLGPLPLDVVTVEGRGGSKFLEGSLRPVADGEITFTKEDWALIVDEESLRGFREDSDSGSS